MIRPGSKVIPVPTSLCSSPWNEEGWKFHPSLPPEDLHGLFKERMTLYKNCLHTILQAIHFLVSYEKSLKTVRDLTPWTQLPGRIFCWQHIKRIKSQMYWIPCVGLPYKQHPVLLGHCSPIWSPPSTQAALVLGIPRLATVMQLFYPSFPLSPAPTAKHSQGRYIIFNSFIFFWIDNKHSSKFSWEKCVSWKVSLIHSPFRSLITSATSLNMQLSVFLHVTRIS